MSTRKIHQSPTFSVVQDGKEIDRLLLEIKKFKPGVEVTIEHHPHLARGKIIDWHDGKKLITIHWTEIPEGFVESSGLRTGLRAFFKASLLSVQILFKCELVRRLPDGCYQYRTPDVFYKNQKRLALRVPLDSGSGTLVTPLGSYPILDLSISGARIGLPLSTSKKIHALENCSLILGKRRISTSRFGVTITSRNDDFSGCRFHGLNEGIHVEIKQFLIEALHEYFKKAKQK